MRPVDWVEYKNINGDETAHSVWMNVAAFQQKRKPAMEKILVYGELGFSVITRRGFEINNETVMSDAVTEVCRRRGLQYHLIINGR
jgi:hypothetical protein